MSPLKLLKLSLAVTFLTFFLISPSVASKSEEDWKNFTFIGLTAQSIDINKGELIDLQLAPTWKLNEMLAETVNDTAMAYPLRIRDSFRHKFHNQIKQHSPNNDLLQQDKSPEEINREDEKNIMKLLMSCPEFFAYSDCHGKFMLESKYDSYNKEKASKARKHLHENPEFFEIINKIIKSDGSEALTTINKLSISELNCLEYSIIYFHQIYTQKISKNIISLLSSFWEKYLENYISLDESSICIGSQGEIPIEVEEIIKRKLANINLLNALAWGHRCNDRAMR